jgi:hypothetical protein
VRISWLRETLPADSKAVSEAPWFAIVAIAGSIAKPESSASRASAQSDLLRLAAMKRRGSPVAFIFALVSPFELDLQSE